MRDHTFLYLTTLRKLRMPFPTKYNAEDDPEEVAEREVEKMNEALGIRSSRPTLKTDVDAKQPFPVKPATKHVKEAKALRKMRNRGVSGSSIKKDGGRFDYGLDYDNDFDDPTENVEEDNYTEYGRYTRGSYSSHSMGIGPMESDSERSNGSANVKRKECEQKVARVRDCLVAALSSGDDGISEISVADLLMEEYDETGRVRLIDGAVNLICSAMGDVVDDSLYEYRLVLIVSRLFQQGLLKASSIYSYVVNALETNHSIRLLSAASKVTENAVNRLELICVVEKLVKDLFEDFDAEIVARDLTKQELVFFHAHFVHQICVEAINSMNMYVIYHAVISIADMMKDNTLDRTSVNIGFLRFFKGVLDMEVDLPGATSLSTLLMSYAVNDYRLIDGTVSCSCPNLDAERIVPGLFGVHFRSFSLVIYSLWDNVADIIALKFYWGPRRFIKADHQGLISVVDRAGVPCTSLNYFIMES